MRVMHKVERDPSAHLIHRGESSNLMQSKFQISKHSQLFIDQYCRVHLHHVKLGYKNGVQFCG